jgi:hypothetical protein
MLYTHVATIQLARGVRHEGDAMRVALARGQGHERRGHVGERVQRGEHAVFPRDPTSTVSPAQREKGRGRERTVSPGKLQEVPGGRGRDAARDEPVRAQEDGDVVQVGAHVRVQGGGGAE